MILQSMHFLTFMLHCSSAQLGSAQRVSRDSAFLCQSIPLRCWQVVRWWDGTGGRVVDGRHGASRANRSNELADEIARCLKLDAAAAEEEGARGSRKKAAGGGGAAATAAALALAATAVAAPGAAAAT